VMSEEKLRSIIRDELENRSRIDCEVHDEHHQFISEFIAESRLRQERWEAIKRQVLGWGIIAIVGSLGSLIANKLHIG